MSQTIQINFYRTVTQDCSLEVELSEEQLAELLALPAEQREARLGELVAENYHDINEGDCDPLDDEFDHLADAYVEGTIEGGGDFYIDLQNEDSVKEGVTIVKAILEQPKT